MRSERMASGWKPRIETLMSANVPPQIAARRASAR
jgi:hypothetical protein